MCVCVCIFCRNFSKKTGVYLTSEVDSEHSFSLHLKCLRGGSRERERGFGDSKFQRGERKGKEDRDREIETETEKEKHRENEKRRGRPKL